MATLAEVMQKMVDNFGLGRRGTNTGTSASQITDAPLLSGSEAGKGLVNGCQILIDAGTEVGSISQLSTNPVHATGVAKVTPDFSGTLSSSSTYIILFRPLRFISGGNAMRDKINQAIAEFKFYKRFVPITRVTDGDMLATDGTAYAGVNATNPPTKTAASFPLGERVLVVTDDGSGGGYAKSANISVEEGKSYYLEAMGYGVDASDAGTLVLVDVTNSDAEISLTEKDIDRMEPEILKNTVTIPSGCKEVQVRLTCTGVDDVIHWGYVIFRNPADKEHTTAARPISPFDMGQLVEPTSNVWNQRGTWNEVPSRRKSVGNGLWRYTHERQVSGSLWYEEFVTLTPLSAMTDTVPIPADDLAAVAAEMLLATVRNTSAEWGGKWQLAKDSAYGVLVVYDATNRTVVKAPSPAPYPRLVT